MLLIFDVLENSNQSLLDRIFYSKRCKCTRVSDCPLSSLEHFLALIPQYKSFTYTVDNDFKLLIGRVNFMTVLSHSLYFSLNLIALMTDTVSIIQRPDLSVLIHKLHQTDNYGNNILDFV